MSSGARFKAARRVDKIGGALQRGADPGSLRSFEFLEHTGKMEPGDHLSPGLRRTLVPRIPASRDS